VLGVVPGEEDVTVPAGVLDRAEALRELSPREVAAVPRTADAGRGVRAAGTFYPTNLTEIIIDIYPPPVASSPLDRGWHIALTLRASAIRVTWTFVR